ncbi:PD-(D/E)XK nuclease family protein [bacterium LRH843]|nr:PD-(D/E)XK nuclease family protein [bacterium LRH843]
MNSNSCPRCGANLIEDAWEHIQETEDGGVHLHAFPAYVCQKQCGYMIEIEETEVPKVIAQQDKDRLLLLYSNNEGRILDLRELIIRPPMHVDSLLARGYWEEYTGNHNMKQLLQEARDSSAAFVEPPNLFEFATSELSQDAFLCWLLKWGMPVYRSINAPLHGAAIAFISEIFHMHHTPVPVINKIEITRQFKSLDILAVINDTYAILIEDKTYTKDHSNQLVRYREEVKKAKPELIQLPIYYKLTDQSHYNSPLRAGYLPFKREIMLSILAKGEEQGVQNDIFLDYYKHVQKIEDDVHSYKTTPPEKWSPLAWQGFYKALQKEISGNWGYVANPRKGFWAFWWKQNPNRHDYMQLEQQKLTVKLVTEDIENKHECIKSTLTEILAESEKRQLYLKKPAKIRLGNTMTIAVRENYIQTNEDGTVNMERTIEELKKY